jgi:hypothetical protein
MLKVPGRMRQALWSSSEMKRLLPLSALLCLGAALLGPAHAGDKGDKDKAEKMPETPYYPLKKDTAWVYAAEGKKINVKVTAHEKVGDLLCAKVETDMGGGVVNIEHLMVKDDGVYRVSVNGEQIKPPYLVLKLPPKMGDSWSVEAKTKGFDITGKLDNAGEQKIKAGGKEYSAWLVKSADLKMGGKAAVVETWYAKDVGMVKLHFNLPAEKWDRVVELESYTAGK